MTLYQRVCCVAVANGVGQVLVDRGHAAGEQRIVEALGHPQLLRLAFRIAIEQIDIGRQRTLNRARTSRLVPRSSSVSSGSTLICEPRRAIDQPPSHQSLWLTRGGVVRSSPTKTITEAPAATRRAPAAPTTGGRSETTCLPIVLAGMNHRLADHRGLQEAQRLLRVLATLLQGRQQARIEIGIARLDAAGDLDLVGRARGGRRSRSRRCQQAPKPASSTSANPARRSLPTWPTRARTPATAANTSQQRRESAPEPQPAQAPSDEANSRRRSVRS